MPSERAWRPHLPKRAGAQAILDERQRRLDEAKQRAAQRLLQPEAARHGGGRRRASQPDDDDDDGEDPLANKKKEPEKTPAAAATAATSVAAVVDSKPSSARGGTGSHKASRLERSAPRSEGGLFPPNTLQLQQHTLVRPILPSVPTFHAPVVLVAASASMDSQGEPPRPVQTY